MSQTDHVVLALYQNLLGGSTAKEENFLRCEVARRIILSGLSISSSGVFNIPNVLGFYNIKDYDAVGNGTTDDTPAFTAAIAALNTAGGGILYMPPGNYRVTSTLDFHDVGPVWLMGAGVRATTITTTVTTTPGIKIAGTNNASHNRCSDFGLSQSGLVLPTVARSGNYGICNVTEIHYHVSIDNVEVRYFGDHGIHIEGATGPTVIRDCSIQNISAYGIAVVDASGQAPQDVRVEGGNLQSCWGGIYGDTCFSLHVSDIDIELSTVGTLPPIHLKNACYGNTFTDVTASNLGAVACTPAGIVTFEGGGGGGPSAITWIGGRVDTSLTTVPNFFMTGGGVSLNTIIGPLVVGAGTGSSSYPFSIQSGVNVTIINPLLSGFETAKRIVYDNGVLGDNAITAIGIDIRSHTPTADVHLPSVAMDGLAVIGVTTLNGDALTTTATGTNNDLNLGAFTSPTTTIRLNNASTLTITGFANGVAGQRLVFVSIGAGQVDFAHENSGSTAANRFINFATSGNTSLAPGSGTAEYIYDAVTARWRMVSHEQGAWITATYNSGDYTASTGTWTVDSGDVLRCQYWLKGRTQTISMYLNATSVSATPGALRRILPGGFTGATQTEVDFVTHVSDNGGALVLSVGSVTSNSTLIQFFATQLYGAWATSTNTTKIIAIFSCEVK